MTTEYKPTKAQLRLRKLIKSKTHIMAFGGARSGKTFEFCRALQTCALIYPGARMAVMRKYYNAVKTSVFNDTFPKMASLCFPGLTVFRNESETFIRYPNGSEVWFLGLDDKERVDKILGREFAIMYFNECSEISYHAAETALTRLSQMVFNDSGKLLRNRAFYDCNPPYKSHWAYRLFIEGVNPVSRATLTNGNEYSCIQINPYDNAENLPADYIDKNLASLSLEKRKRFLHGEWLDENENALWKLSSMIDPFRVVSAPTDLERIVVGVDPAVTSKESSDETGIVVVGKKKWGDGKSHYYVLDDSTVRDTPHKWAIKIADTYRRYSADRIVAEVNQGGDLVQELINSVGAGLPVKTVRATRGKIVRAEPIAALYEQGLVHHVGSFPELEDEMTSYTGYDSETSPDRMDALVWAITELADAPEVNFDNTSFF